MANKSLTPLSVKNAKPNDGKRREIPDGRGLYLVVQPSGAKSWAYRYRFQGRPAKLTLGPVYIPRDGEPEPSAIPAIGDPLTLAQARRLVSDGQHQLARRADPAASVRAAKQRQSTDPDRDLFEVVAQRFLERYARPNTRESTFRETSTALGYRIGPAGKLTLREPVKGGGNGAAVSWRGRKVQTITRRDVNEMLDGIEDARGGNAANAALAAVRRLFNWSVEQDVVAVSPVAGVKRRLAPVQRDRVLADDELRLIWLAAGEVGWPFGHLVKLLALTGARRDEWAGARWSEIRLDRKAFELPAERSKNGLAHTIPLAPAALTIIEELARIRLKGEPDWLLSTGYGRTAAKGHPVLAPISGFSKAKASLDKKILEIARREAQEAGLDPTQVQPLPEWRFHDLRRTCVTGMARLGVALPVIERAVNHVSGSFAGVVGVYQKHQYAPEVRAALERWAEAVEHVAAGEDAVSSNVVPIKA